MILFGFELAYVTVASIIGGTASLYVLIYHRYREDSACGDPVQSDTNIK